MNSLYYNLIIAGLIFLIYLLLSLDKERRYKKGLALLKEKKYKEANDVFWRIRSFRDCAKYTKYSKALECYSSEDQKAIAYELLDELGSFRDSEQYLEGLHKLLYVDDFTKAKDGSYVTFGRYKQEIKFKCGEDAEVEPEPIDWIVIGTSENEILLVSRFVLDCKPFNEENIDTKWEECSLRKWMNNDFYNMAFNEEEKSHIMTCTLYNLGNPAYEESEGGPNTYDKVFCLSIDEAQAHFKSNKSRIARMTPYALKHCSKVNTDGHSHTWWWLRSPGYNNQNAAHVSRSGYVGSYGDFVSIDYYGVRPCICYKFKPITEKESGEVKSL